MQIVTSINATNLSAPGLYTQIIQPPPYIRGVPTDVFGVVGTASWGPVNQPVHMGNGGDATQAFGPISAVSLTDAYDLATDLYIAFGQAGVGGTNEGWAVRVTDGTDVAATGTIAGASSSSLTITARCTGILGNSITAVITAGAQSSTFTCTIYPFSGQPEVFSNLPSSGFWTKLEAAINTGLNGVRGPSQYVIASSPTGSGAPTVQSNSMSSGTDGRSGVTTANLTGSASATPPTGIFALSNTNPAVSVAWIAGLTDVDAPATILPFGQTAAACILFSTTAGLTTAEKISAVQGIGIADPSFLPTGDWIYFFDPINKVTRLVPECPFVGGAWTSLNAWQSLLNQELNLIVGTERNNPITGTQPYSNSETGLLQNAGILNIENPCPGGAYFGLATGANTSANPATSPMEYWRMTAFLARSFNAVMGLFVGQNQSQQPNDPLRNAVRSSGNTFLTNLLGANGIDSFAFICGFSAAPSATPGLGVNTPASIAQHYIYALAQVTYLASVWYFIMQIQGGTTVVTVSAGNEQSPI